MVSKRYQKLLHLDASPAAVETNQLACQFGSIPEIRHQRKVSAAPVKNSDVPKELH
jgi:hypothetical protein